MIEQMQIPKTRAEFENRFHLLREKMRQGKFHVVEGVIKGIDGILKVRYLPNGRIDFLSVNESARLLANSTFQFECKVSNVSTQNQEAQNESKNRVSNHSGDIPE